MCKRFKSKKRLTQKRKAVLENRRLRKKLSPKLKAPNPTPLNPFPIPTSLNSVSLELAGYPSAQLLLFHSFVIEKADELEFRMHGLLYKYDEGLGDALLDLLGFSAIFMSPSQRANFKEKSYYFKTEGVQLAQVNLITPWGNFIAATDVKGHFNLTFSVPADLEQLDVLFRANVFTLVPTRVIPGSTNDLIISDIDDTVKKTNVLDKWEALKNTFLRDFVEVEGMASLYKDLAQRGDEVFYVTGGPWQLYAPLVKFFNQEGFASPSRISMRTAFLDSVLSIPQILGSSTEEYKRETISNLISNLLNHQGGIILIGDEGEKDPEVYDYIAKLFDNQVKNIFIRVLDGSRGERLKRVLNRFSPAIRSRVFTYSTGDQLRKHLNA